MMLAIQSPVEATYWFITGRVLFFVISLLGSGVFLYILSRRIVPLLHAAPDPRFDHILLRLGNIGKFWLAQWKQPRYVIAGLLHIVIFTGFLALVLRSASMVALGVFLHPTIPLLNSSAYGLVKDYAATLVFMAVILCAIHRLVLKPDRYAVPANRGKSHTPEAIIVLALIGILMLSESLFNAAAALLNAQPGQGGEQIAPLSLAWLLNVCLLQTPSPWLQHIYHEAYLVHDVTFFAFLCLLPFGKHFHVITSLFNVYFAKLDRTELKPVRWNVNDQDLAQVNSFGVKKFEDFTWKHILDFYSCADCGRCSDNCPANAVGRPLSPRFLTTKARNYAFQHYPMLGQAGNGQPLIGTIFSADEIWSCTTCGACERECPLLVEYIDKIVDLRRGLVDDGNVPQSLQKPLKALESRGNPYGKMEKKRADWANAQDFQQVCNVKTVDNPSVIRTLYFVDSVTSYDDRMKSVARATAKILDHVGENFGILGATEKDSGHEVRRFGEETLFLALRDHNTEAVKASGAKKIVTNDPHAFNALRHDYKDLPPVEHISQVLSSEVKRGKITFNPLKDDNKIYAFHDPCYLGRHNQIYDDPREVLDAIPGLKRVEMKRSRDRSFCCGGGGLMLFYEPKEEERMGVRRVKMAAEAGANVIVTACPFCMVNIEDAIKVAGLESKMSVIDLAELADRQIARPEAVSTSASPAMFVNA